MVKNNKLVLRIFIYINILFIISLIAPIIWNPIYLFESIVFEFLFGDFLTLVFLFFLLIILSLLYFKINIKKYLILLSLVFVLTISIDLLFSILKYQESLVEGFYASPTISESYNFYLSEYIKKWDFILNDNISNNYLILMINFNNYGLLNFIIFVLFLGNVSLLSSFIFSLFFITLFIFLIIWFSIKFYLIKMTYIKLSKNSNIYLIGQYDSSNLESIDLEQNQFYDEYIKEIKMNKQDFITKINTATKNQIFLIKTDWCGECYMTENIFKRLVNNPENENISFEIIDADKLDLWIEQDDFFNIKEVPTIIFYKQGKEIDRLTNFVSEEKLTKFIQKNNSDSISIKE